MATSILSQILKIYQFFMIFIFSKFLNLEKTPKIDENGIARQNGSVKMIATTFRRDSDQHPATKKKCAPQNQNLFSQNFALRTKIPIITPSTFLKLGRVT